MAIEHQGLLAVQMDIEPEWEVEFNRWYDEEHFPERLACPGFVGADRYVKEEGGGTQYLAIYQLADTGVLEQQPYLAIRPSSKWGARLQPHWKSVRTVYRKITPTIPAGYEVNADRESLA